MEQKDERKSVSYSPNREMAYCFYDAHCHALSGWEEIQFPSRSPISGGFLCCASHSDFQTVQSLAKSPPKDFDLLVGIGIHPWYLPASLETVERELATILEESPRAAVGEIGLHFTQGNRSGTERDRQRQLFQIQLDLARNYRRGVVIHSVHAAAEILRILKDSPLLSPVLFHSLSADQETVRQMVRLGGWFSFSAKGLLPDRRRSRETARAVPLNRILAESDAATARKSAADIPIAIERLAQLRQVPFDSLAAQIAENWRCFSDALFPKREKSG